MLRMLALLQLTHRKNGNNRLKSIAFSMFLTFCEQQAIPAKYMVQDKSGRINYGNN